MDPRAFFRYPYMRFMVTGGSASEVVDQITALAQKHGWHIPLRTSFFNKSSRSLSSDFRSQGFRSVLHVEPTRVGNNWEVRLRLNDSLRSTFSGDTKKAVEALQTLHVETVQMFSHQHRLAGADQKVHHKVSLNRPGFEIFQSWS